jgi:hypothetical protein
VRGVPGDRHSYCVFIIDRFRHSVKNEDTAPMVFLYGSVGRAPGNRCLYPEPDRKTPAGLSLRTVPGYKALLPTGDPQPLGFWITRPSGCVAMSFSNEIQRRRNHENRSIQC